MQVLERLKQIRIMLKLENEVYYLKIKNKGDRPNGVKLRKTGKA